MSLERYRKKRNFSKTDEPRGQRTKGAGNSFVVQKHAARALHYDFRLELDGVLLSWAVPKGPSLDPKVKRLAMQVEDHPVEYGGFEGEIPRGEYGAGKVIVWDRGTWTPEEEPHEALRKGRLTFRLDGEKLRGGFHLVRTSKPTAKRASWLLFKATDEEARKGDAADIVNARPESVLSGRGVDGARSAPRIATKKTAARSAAKSTRARAPRRGKLPDFVQPELATLVDAAPAGAGYLHEIKLDGYRILARIEGGEVRLLSRRGNDWSARLPSIVRALEALPLDDSILDGEVVAFDESGVSDFQRLQNSMEAGKDGACFYVVFDALFLDGEDLRALPLIERKQALADRLPKKALGKGPLRLGEHVVGDGDEFFSEACKLGLEGIVSKRVDAPYVSRRDRSWLKVKCTAVQEFVIGGFTDPEGSRGHFGALLLGVREKDGLRYVGKVGTGFSAQSLAEIGKRLGPLEQRKPPFVNPPRGYDAKGVHWIAPELVAQIRFAERTAEGILRHASFQGLRDDKPARDVHDERPEPANPGRSRRRASNDGTRAVPRDPPLLSKLALSNPDRVLYAEQGVKKRDLAAYYARVADFMLPHVAERPLTLVRCPEGIGKQCFFQKHPSRGMPDAIDTFPIAEKKGTKDYLVVHDALGLVSLVQLGALEIHTWGSKIAAVEQPDQLVFDLDPDPDLPPERLIEAAADVRSALESLGLTGFLKTTGGKGLHVVAPIEPELDWDSVKRFCKALVEQIAQKKPSRYLTTMTKAKRKGKIFLDYLRNSRGATAICAYSTRARPGAPVSVPLAWDELARAPGDGFDIVQVPERLRTQAADPWRGFDDARGSLKKIL
ncbi:MAG TPA: DNA ligase D [Polyangiaceae bacterium]|nr:DNA ligase D [Polyangiaceae bacterium]